MLPTVDILIPVLNEEDTLREGVTSLLEFLKEHGRDFDWRVVVVDNGSTDSTNKIGYSLVMDCPRVDYCRLEERGVGRALRFGMKRSTAAVMVYLDLDMKASWPYIPVVVNAALAGGYDLAFGSRLMPDSLVVGRKFWRVVTSRVNSLVIRTLFFPFPFRDVQCGLKAFSRRIVHGMLDDVKDEGWFFNPEFVLRGHLQGYQLLEVPIYWVDDPDSAVNIYTVSAKLLRGYFGLKAESCRTWWKRVRGGPSVAKEGRDEVGK